MTVFICIAFCKGTVPNSTLTTWLYLYGILQGHRCPPPTRSHMSVPVWHPVRASSRPWIHYSRPRLTRWWSHCCGPPPVTAAVLWQDPPPHWWCIDGCPHSSWLWSTRWPSSLLWFLLWLLVPPKTNNTSNMLRMNGYSYRACTNSTFPLFVFLKTWFRSWWCLNSVPPSFDTPSVPPSPWTIHLTTRLPPETKSTIPRSHITTPVVNINAFDVQQHLLRNNPHSHPAPHPCIWPLCAHCSGYPHSLTSQPSNPTASP